jgi:hypothetical protein
MFFLELMLRHVRFKANAVFSSVVANPVKSDVFA